MNILTLDFNSARECNRFRTSTRVNGGCSSDLDAYNRRPAMVQLEQTASNRNADLFEWHVASPLVQIRNDSRENMKDAS